MGIYVYKIHLSGKIFQIAVSFDRLSNILIGQHAFRTKRLVKYFGDKRNKRKIFFVPISKILVPTAFRMYFSRYNFFLNCDIGSFPIFFVTTFFYCCQNYASILQMKPSHKIFFSCQKPFL